MKVNKPEYRFIFLWLYYINYFSSHSGGSGIVTWPLGSSDCYYPESRAARLRSRIFSAENSEMTSP